MKNLLKLAAFALLPAALFVACEDDDDDTPGNGGGSSSISATTLEANEFVYSVMGVYYYWNAEMFNDKNYTVPKIDYRKEPDTEAYFEKLRSDEDLFSFISDDADAMQDQLDGVSTTMGWDYTLTYYDATTQQVCAIINYVFKDSPAYEAGVKRGDIIVTVSGSTMNLNNYWSLINQTTGTFGAMRYNATTEQFDDIEYKLTARTVAENPVAEYEVFETENGNIGYLMYYSFISDYNDDLDEVFAHFKANNVTELILDLRYNTGGEMLAMNHLCSCIAPEANVRAEDELVWYSYNDLLTELDPEGFGRESNSTDFVPDIANNLNLSRVVIITGNNSYSASEATIIGLEPYMDVVCIGETTGGKNSSMYVITPDLYENEDGSAAYSSAINNWLIAPIVAVYYNSDDFTFDPSKGIAPDYEVSELDYLASMGELGSPDEPVTAAAIEYLTTGTVSATNKAATVKPTIIGHTANRFKGAIMPTK